MAPADTRIAVGLALLVVLTIAQLAGAAIAIAIYGAGVLVTALLWRR